MDSLADTKNIALICNPLAGKGRAVAILDQLQQKLNARGLPYTVFGLDWPEDLGSYASAWIIGGDGTLNHFINRYPEIQIPIALFRGGSGNDFAWKLYGDKPADEYAEAVLRGIPKPIDAGICNGRYFINGIGIGFDGEVVKSMGGRKILPGHLGYLYTVLRKIFFYQEREIQIITQSESIQRPFFMVTIANGSRIGGGFLVSPQAVLDDGELDLVTITRIPKLKRLLYLPKVEKGQHLSLKFVVCRRIRQVRIQTIRSVAAQLDGELMEGNNFEISVLPGKYLFYI